MMILSISQYLQHRGRIHLCKYSLTGSSESSYCAPHVLVYTIYKVRGMYITGARGACGWLITSYKTKINSTHTHKQEDIAKLREATSIYNVAYSIRHSN